MFTLDPHDTLYFSVTYPVLTRLLPHPLTSCNHLYNFCCKAPDDSLTESVRFNASLLFRNLGFVTITTDKVIRYHKPARPLFV